MIPARDAAAMVFTPPLAANRAWPTHTGFLCCIVCGRQGRFVDPFPKIPR